MALEVSCLHPGGPEKTMKDQLAKRREGGNPFFAPSPEETPNDRTPLDKVW